MSSLKEKFETPLPTWVDEISKEAHNKIITAPFAAECFEGSAEAVRKQMVGLWPFVDEFPHMLNRGCRRLFFNLDLMVRYGPVDVINLLSKGRQILQEIKVDEEDHRKLWLMTSEALGLQYPTDFSREVLPETKVWMNKVDEKPDIPFMMFMRFTAIEIIAESISCHLLGSKKFCDVLGKRGVRWFKAHVHPEDQRMTHKELALHLGFAMHLWSPSKEECSRYIQEIVDLFLAAAEASRTAF